MAKKKKTIIGISWQDLLRLAVARAFPCSDTDDDKRAQAIAARSAIYVELETKIYAERATRGFS